MANKNKSLSLFALGPSLPNNSTSSNNNSPFMKYQRLLTRNEKLGIGILILILILSVVFFLHWKNIINIPFLPASTKQHKNN